LKTAIHRPVSIPQWIWKIAPTRHFLVLILVCLITVSSKAEPQVATLGIGVAFAPIGGNGFSLRKLPETGFGYQVGTIFWKNNGDSYLNLGAELLYVLKRNRLTAFYVPFGVAFYYSSQLQYRYDPLLPNSNQEYRETTKSFAGGAGLGFAARPASWDNVWFSLDLVMVADQGDILPLPQCAIHYFFR
jgi:hypothetical protein